jgi:hypothetical protein
MPLILNYVVYKFLHFVPYSDRKRVVSILTAASFEPCPLNA